MEETRLHNDVLQYRSEVIGMDKAIGVIDNYVMENVMELEQRKHFKVAVERIRIDQGKARATLELLTKKLDDLRDRRRGQAN